MPKALVLGAGMVGSVMAVDLAADDGWQVTVADIRETNLAAVRTRLARTGAVQAGSSLRTVAADLADPRAVMRLAAEADVVLGALSSRIGLVAMRAVIDAGRPYADISFMAEDPTEPTRGLHALAQSRGVTVVYDFGVAPGMSHLLAAHGASRLDRCDAIEIYVGGLPRERRWPFQYKAAFAPADVIEEYTRPARLVERGEIVTREALSEPELMDFAGVGTLEAFNTDGLRSLCGSHRGRVPWMKEKTLRYPGHIELMRAFRAAGLFDESAIDVPSSLAPGAPAARVSPRDVTARLLFPQWTYEPGEEDLTVMRVLALGEKGGARARHQWDLLDFFDRTTQSTSMARTTALPCAVLARMLVADPSSPVRFHSPGVNAPESVALGSGGPARVEHILAELATRRIVYTPS
ncbi:MAG: saccharopine dehydrogenase family protein [Phycisphaerales bacterium]